MPPNVRLVTDLRTNKVLWNATFNRRLIRSACWAPLTGRRDECMQKIVQASG
jgi:hypothetical protein